MYKYGENMKFEKPMFISGNWDVISKRYRQARTIYTWEELDAEIYYAKVQVAWQSCPRRKDGLPDMRFKTNKENPPHEDIVQALDICYPTKKGVYK